MNIRPSILLLALLAAGCASVNGAPAADDTPAPPAKAVEAQPQKAPGSEAPSRPADAKGSAEAAPSLAPDKGAVKEGSSGKSRVFLGDDKVFKRDVAPKVDPVLATGDRVSLNFENVTVGNLAVALLGDLLKLNYTVDAGGETMVSLRTRQPLLRSQVLDVLDAVLLPHDLAIVRDNAGVYHVTKRAVTVGARPVVGSSRLKDLSGAGTVIVPLNHIAAAEMAKILAPLAPREAIVYVDSLRNLLVLQGSKAQLGGWLEMVEAFDVDFLAGMSLGVFVLENANVNVVRDAIQAILGGEKSADPFGGASSAAPAGGNGGGGGGAAAAAAAATSGAGGGGGNPLSGLVRMFPVERLNALVVVSPRSQVVSQMETWIRRLDRPTDTLEPHLFVYPVQNGSAVHLAEMLNGLFSSGASGAAGKAGVAAGSAPTQFSQASLGGAAGNLSGNNANRSTTLGGSNTGSASTPTLGAGGSSSTSTATQQLSSVTQLEGNVRVVADDKRNALLIRAPRAEYRRIEQALRDLDKAPTQVLIEASILEIQLTGDLKYGVEWFVENSLSRDRTGQAVLNLRDNPSTALSTPQSGFTYSIFNKANLVRATINALEGSSRLRVLSNPSILVLDNHSATIMVGRQQPIKGPTTISNGGGFVSDSIIYKDTGVMLSVTPSVNAGGLVTLDIMQQVIDVGTQDPVTSQFVFNNRQIQSRVAVRSGDPIVLGGVMNENDKTTKSGVPVLSNVPLLGALFSKTGDAHERTELLVMLTPRVLEDDDALRSASVEFRQRMKTMSLQSIADDFRPSAAPAPAGAKAVTPAAQP